jgi:hypothetical protein
VTPRQKRGTVLRGVNIAAREPVNLAVAGAAVFTAPLLGAWWPLMLGTFAYLLLIVCRVASPTWLQQALASDDAARSALPDETRLATPALRTTVAQIRNGRATVMRVLSEASTEVRAHVQRAITGVDELERCAADLVQRADAMAQFLANIRRESLQAEAIRLTDQVQRAADPEAKREYHDALVARQEQLALVEDVERRQERVMARLHRIAAIIDGIPSRIVHLQLLQGATDEPKAELDELMAQVHGEFRSSEQVLATIDGFIDGRHDDWAWSSPVDRPVAIGPSTLGS